MFGKLKAAIAGDPLDTQIWECTPLAILDRDEKVVYWHETKIEMKPYPRDATKIGHAVALSPDASGIIRELDIVSMQHVDAPLFINRRAGIILSGENLTGDPETWLINGEADRAMTSTDFDFPEYDEETANELERELNGQEPDKWTIDSVF